MIVSVRLAEPVPPGFVAVMITLLVPGVEGVPVIAPVVAFTLNPDGSPLAP